MPIHTQKISEFLRIVEGPQQVRGYIPCWLLDAHGQRRPNSKGGFKSADFRGDAGQTPAFFEAMGVSGVTIGTGVDLGQTAVDTLRRIGVYGSLVTNIAKYIGLRKASAIAALHDAPLIISRADADILDHCMHSHHASLIEKRYDRDAGVGAYASLPWQAQVAIFSILFQRGTGSPKNFTNTWAAFVRRDWADASARLCNARLWSGYQSRRRQEGELLREVA